MHLFLILCALGVNVAALAGYRSPELRVVTSSGSLNGIYNNSAQTVRAFLGIPYAEPPVNELRWAPPHPKSPTRSPIDASSFSSPCPQVYRYSNESIWSILPYMIWNSGDMSEDCLYMNIWAPSIKHRDREVHKAAVMMFIHGGSFDTGSSSVAYYDGTNLVQNHDDLIVITFNYRLNVFGFPNAPDIDPSKQNLGLLDQVDRKYNPLVSAIALHSGTAPLLTSAPDHRNWNELSIAVGCGVGAQSFQCMKQLPAMKIVETRAQGNYTFFPIVDNVLVFSDHAARAEMGKLARLPTLAGITGREYSAFLPLSQTSLDETAIYVLGQQIFNCPLRESMRIRVDHQVPSWRYVYHGNFTNLSPLPWLGAYHGCKK
ncbi:unnamed protein product [Penicillium egyptiacum]|uniref:Carboxylesterase type B domain-containing protein n=1 Tax=Penicillium egyptiacum TaxID=1303716 RepID=A0A9W4K9U5_9EURO|nr:unnamed protein product [Penicillium egyptiacum]